MMNKGFGMKISNDFLNDLSSILNQHNLHLSEEQLNKIALHAQLIGKQEEAHKIRKNHLQRMKEFEGDNVATFLRTLFDEGYESLWPFLFGSGQNLSGKITGDYFEEMLRTILRFAAKGSLIKIGAEHPRYDVVANKANVRIISFECKMQSDKTSFIRNAVDHINENYNEAVFVGAALCTNAFITKKGEEEIVVRLSQWTGNIDKARELVKEMKRKECGFFRINEKVFIVILGRQTDKYKRWDGTNYQNHGGTKAWELDQQAVQETVDSFQQMIENYQDD